MTRALIVIPARMQATRLPGKPLADINGQPMIVHVLRRALASGAGRVAVATDSPEIAAAVTAAGGEAVMTRADHQSGSDRVHEAVGRLDPEREVSVVVNVQGDLPTLNPALIATCAGVLEKTPADIATLAALITEERERTDPAVVKVAATPVAGDRLLRALYFSRATIPSGEGPLLHHIGLYAFRREALDRFVGLPPARLEQREKLEQLRALEAGMRIDVALVDTVPMGVDTPADLERARSLLASRT
ncbi:MAG: 3-deoxy-manno-octulosonate cytidylyltransferase [Hyphomicrobiales bacterium]